MLTCGAFGFGAVIGWFTYYTMRYSPTHALSDIAVVIGAVGGAAVFAMFPAQTPLFGYYGVGLAVGFFAYVLIYVFAIVTTEGWAGLVRQSKEPNPVMGARDPNRTI